MSPNQHAGRLIADVETAEPLATSRGVPRRLNAERRITFVEIGSRVRIAGKEGRA